MAPTTKATLPIAVAVLCALTNTASSQSQPQTSPEPLRQSVPSFELVHEDITNGIAKLNQMTTSVAFAIEFPLGRTISASSPSLPTVVATVGPGTLGDALDRLCDLDRTFSWQRIGNTIHLLPRALENDPAYLLNRKIEDLEIKNAPDAQNALFQTIALLEGAKEQIAVMQTGMSLGFASPWTASLKDLTVREALDKIAQQLGRNYGWQFGGAADFRVVTFHERICPKPSLSEHDLSKRPAGGE